ncbi:MAG TPA: hypothetical protein VMI53_09060 [Opitutaceae bacterium]|nr:hypothetical protein [Opitutaceae bacterium]
MSAQEAKKDKNTAPKPVPAAAPAPAATPAAPPPAWIDDTSNPRRQMIARVVFVAVCIYVAMIWLLALDQTFHWGIFKP